MPSSTPGDRLRGYRIIGCIYCDIMKEERGHVRRKFARRFFMPSSIIIGATRQLFYEINMNILFLSK